jgi:glutamyl-tRNA synthetase
MAMASQVRVRFAPSPTGYLHVGGARTALFNYLFARHNAGKFILRIEDTDFSRSSEEMVEGILRGMRWLRLDWDEGPIFQSQRIPRYQEFARSLLESGGAYRCYCQTADPGQESAVLSEEEESRVSSCRCSSIPGQESERRAAAGEAFAVRFRVPHGSTCYQDHVFGRIEVDNENIEDFVLLRRGGIPTYHLGVVVDDVDMAITHVIRGADHISNTPKQILLYRAAGQTVPEFAHLPLILGPDRQRLSKRHGATSVMAYAEMGYLPEAFFNFLALLGWSPGDDREIMSRRELIDRFTLEGVGKANAVFGTDKLDWFNSQYLQAAPAEELHALIAKELESKGIWSREHPPYPKEKAAPILELLRSRMRKLTDFSSVFLAYFTDDFAYDQAAADKFLKDPLLKILVPQLIELYASDESFSLESTEKHLRSLADSKGVKAGLLINAVRVGLTGQGVAPSLFEVMQVLGRDRTLSRLRRLAQYLASV